MDSENVIGKLVSSNDSINLSKLQKEIKSATSEDSLTPSNAQNRITSETVYGHTSLSDVQNRIISETIDNTVNISEKQIQGDVIQDSLTHSDAQYRINDNTLTLSESEVQNRILSFHQDDLEEPICIDSDSGSYTDSLDERIRETHIRLLNSHESDPVPLLEPEIEPEVPKRKVKRKKKRKSRLPVPSNMTTANPTRDQRVNHVPDSSEDGAIASKVGDPVAENSDIYKSCDKMEQIEYIVIEKINDDQGDLHTDCQHNSQVNTSKTSSTGDGSAEQDPVPENQSSCDQSTVRHNPKCQRSHSTEERGSKDSSRSSLPRRETIDIPETKTVCAGRCMKETKMDLFMNSNEGFLLPHGHNPSTINTSSNPNHKDTITSRLRIEKAHNEHLESEKSPLEYLTPFQRKEYAIKDLKRQMKQLNKVLDDRDAEIDQLREGLGKETQAILKTKDEKIQEVHKQFEDSSTRYEELKRSYEESVKTINNLEDTVGDLKESIAQQNQKNDRLYLEMYVKGQNAARYEREEEIEQMAGKVNDKLFKKTSVQPEVNVKELLAKLNRTQAELAKWQSLRRGEAYQEPDGPETEAEATLRFLRDSFFHYVTDSKDQDDHMRAMIQIFNFTEVQKKKISKSLLEKKSKS